MTVRQEQTLDQWMGGFSDIRAAFGTASVRKARGVDAPKADSNTEYKQFAELDLSNMGM